AAEAGVEDHDDTCRPALGEDAGHLGALDAACLEAVDFLLRVAPDEQALAALRRRAMADEDEPQRAAGLDRAGGLPRVLPQLLQGDVLVHEQGHAVDRDAASLGEVLEPRLAVGP